MFDMTIEIKVDEKLITDEINKVWNNLTNEQKEASHKADQEFEKLMNSTKDCTWEEKRVLAKNIKAIIEEIKNLYNYFDIESFQDDKIDIIDTIDTEIEELQNFSMTL